MSLGDQVGEEGLQMLLDDQVGEEGVNDVAG